MNRPPRNSPELVYVLVKIRKFLEHSNLKKQFWMLTFFCDWVLHTKLDRSGARKILEIFDSQLGKFNPAEPDKLHWKDEALKTLSLDVLRDQLLDFLNQSRLPSVWAKDEFVWKDTLRFYGEEVRDTPLTLTGKNLKHLRRLVITACEPAECIVEANPPQTWWGLNWQFTLRDGQTFAAPYTTNVPQPPAEWKTQGTTDR
jgi:hypothetical protein